MPRGKCLGSLSTARLTSDGAAGESTGSISTLWKQKYVHK